MTPGVVPETIIRCREQLSYLETIYPGFRKWFDCKVQPGIANGTRYLDVVEYDGKLVGIVIAKNLDGEKKLCTVWVHPDFRGRGIGIRLIRESCLWLKTDRPLVSVSEANHADVDKLLRKLGFTQTSSKMNPKTGLIEHYYNETEKEDDHVKSGAEEIKR